LYLARVFAASSGSIITAGVGAAGGRGTGSFAKGGNEAGEEASGGRVTGGGK